MSAQVTADKHRNFLVQAVEAEKMMVGDISVIVSPEKFHMLSKLLEYNAHEPDEECGMCYGHKEVVCSTCRGSGSGKSGMDCPVCYGSGKVPCPYC